MRAWSLRLKLSGRRRRFIRVSYCQYKTLLLPHPDSLSACALKVFATEQDDGDDQWQQWTGLTACFRDAKYAEMGLPFSARVNQLSGYIDKLTSSVALQDSLLSRWQPSHRMTALPQSSQAPYTEGGYSLDARLTLS